MFLIGISCAWILGIILGSIYHLPFFLIFTGLIPVPLAFMLRKYRKYLVLSSLCLATLFGAIYYYPVNLARDLVSSFNNQGIIEIRGVIYSQPENRDNTTHIELEVKEIIKDSVPQNTAGKILVFAARYPEYQYGDVLLLKGKLEEPPKFDDFDYQAYLARDGIYSTMLYPQIKVMEKGTGSPLLEWIYQLRKRLSIVLSKVLPEPQASLAQGIILGINSAIPDSLRTNLSITGTAHLLAISGINLSIIVGLLVTLGLWIFGRRHYIYVWLGLAVIWFYALITGMQAPVLRAAIMASMILFAELLGRQKSSIAALAFSAAIMVGIDPQILWSISFQLSFISMLGLVLIAPSLQNLGRKAIHLKLNEESYAARAAILVADSFSVTFGALVMVWPIIAYNFGIISFVGPLATFLIAPSLPFIIVLGILTAFTGLISLQIAQVFGWAVWLFLSYMFWSVTAFGALPAASMKTRAISSNLVWAYYVIIIAFIWIKSISHKLAHAFSDIISKLKNKLSLSPERLIYFPKKWIIIPLILIASLTTYTAAILPDNNLHVSFLNVGEGDSILIQTGNQTILIDGGPSPQAVCLGLSNKMPFWDRKIDLLVLTHPHLDHLAGLIEILKRYKVNQVLAPNLTPVSPAYQEWLNLIKTHNIRYTIAQSGQRVNLINGAVLDVLNPNDAAPSSIESDMENKGIVTKLILNEVSFLFTADIGFDGEAELVNQRAELSSTVLKVAHHGSATSTSREFLNMVNPQIAVISSSANNPFGHPDAKVIARLNEALGSENNIYRTDLSGTVEFTTDGKRLWVKTD